jgi:hypothetical protein
VQHDDQQQRPTALRELTASPPITSASASTPPPLPGCCKVARVGATQTPASSPRGYSCRTGPETRKARTAGEPAPFDRTGAERCREVFCSWRFARLAVGRRADLLSAARGAHDAGQSRPPSEVGSAAHAEQHALAIAEEQ